eukprot:285833-Chlamydomonas_euryale.AAC.1
MCEAPCEAPLEAAWEATHEATCEAMWEATWEAPHEATCEAMREATLEATCEAVCEATSRLLPHTRAHLQGSARMYAADEASVTSGQLLYSPTAAAGRSAPHVSLHQTDWDDHLPTAAFAINTAKQASTPLFEQAIMCNQSMRAQQPRSGTPKADPTTKSSRRPRKPKAISLAVGPEDNSTTQALRRPGRPKGSGASAVGREGREDGSTTQALRRPGRPKGSGA